MRRKTLSARPTAFFQEAIATLTINCSFVIVISICLSAKWILKRSTIRLSRTEPDVVEGQWSTGLLVVILMLPDYSQPFPLPEVSPPDSALLPGPPATAKRPPT